MVRRNGDPTAPVDEAAPQSEVLTVHRNECLLVGRLTTAALARELPSGDDLITWRIVVDRPAGARRRSDGRGQDYDLVDCTTWNARVRKSAARWQVGDIVELHGALRRRFWRAPGGALQSKCELEVATARRLSAANSQVTRPRRTG